MSEHAARPPAQDDEYGFDTRAVRAGFERSLFGEHTEPVFLSSSFVHDSAAHAAAKFAGEAELVEPNVEAVAALLGLKADEHN